MSAKPGGAGGWGGGGGRRRGKRLKVVASGRTIQAFSTSESYRIC